jgi:hypothetical protein
MKPISAKFYDDPSHGWYAVKRSILATMGLLGAITSFSYQKGDTVYLEEDCDASAFFARAKSQGLTVVIKKGATTNTGQYSSPIRSYESFRIA